MRVVHRLDTAAFALVRQLDGRQSVAELWQAAMQHDEHQTPTQPELLELLAQLHESDLLVVNRRLDTEQLFSRSRKAQRRESRQRYLNPLYARVRVIDPDTLLNHLAPLGRWLFSRTACGLFLLIGAWRCSPWHRTGHSSGRRWRSWTCTHRPLIGLFLVVYPLLKLVHELAHGLAVKRRGGDVHELGIALMVLLPIPYVDASAATLFADKRDRMLVSAAGILVEIAIAAVAALVWVNSQGPLHELALLLMVIAGFSTLLFNGNPLLKFDGYYLLADAIEIPNLAQRSQRYLLELGRTVLFGLTPREPAPLDRAERWWLIGYGLASTLYRVALILAIAWMLSGEYFFFGLLLALWAIGTQILIPGWRFVRFLHRQTADRRPRALLVSLALGLTLGALVTWLPMPRSTLVTGVVWLPENAIVRAASTCEVTEAAASDGQHVESGDRLLQCHDDDLDLQARTLAAERDELQARSAALALSNPVEQVRLQAELDLLDTRLSTIDRQITGQTLSAAIAGRFVPNSDLELQGQHFAQGAVIAYIVPNDHRTIRVAVRQALIEPFRHAVDQVELQFADAIGQRRSFASDIVQRTPQASREVVSASLTREGGGSLGNAAIDEPRMVSEPVIDMEVRWPDDAPMARVGSHVQVRFVHPAAPLLGRLTTAVQRSLLDRINT